MEDIRILTAGDSSLLIEFGHEINPEINRKIKSMVELMKEQHIEGVLDVIPAFCSLLINYDPRVTSYAEITRRMKKLLKVKATMRKMARAVRMLMKLNSSVKLAPISWAMGPWPMR